MTLQTIAGILGGAIFGLFIGVWLGWGARTLNITKAGYTIMTVDEHLCVVRTSDVTEALEGIVAKVDSHELRE